MTPERKTYLRNLLLMGLFTLLILEGMARLLILVAGSRLEEPIRPTSEILAEQTTRIEQLLATDQHHLLVIDTLLGWRYQSNWRDTLTALNAEDLRSDHEYALQPPAGRRRVALFGDSFVYGNEVALRDSWARLTESADTTLEMLNYGVGGFGDDQAYLRYQAEGATLSPDIAVLGFTTDDLSRVVNVYRRFRSTQEPPVFKPRFHLTDGRLSLTLSPVRTEAEYRALLTDPRAVLKFGADDHWFEPLIYRDPLYNVSAVVRLCTEVWIRLDKRYFDTQRMFAGDQINDRSEAFQIQVALFQAFHDLALSRHQTPLILFLPERTSLGLQREGRAAVYAPLVRALEAAHVPYLDAAGAFSGVSTPLDRLFMPGGHYSAEANQSVARWLAGQLRSTPLIRQ